MIIIQNTGVNDFQINVGDKIAQMVFKRVPMVELQEISEKPCNGS